MRRFISLVMVIHVLALQSWAIAQGSAKQMTTIGVVGGLCNCGNHAGGFDATYRGRRIFVRFEFDSSPEQKGIVVRINQKMVPPPDNIALICTWLLDAGQPRPSGREVATKAHPCGLTGIGLAVAGV